MNNLNPPGIAILLQGLSLAFLLLLGTGSWAQPPTVINYQGILTDDEGILLDGENQNVVMSLWLSPSNNAIEQKVFEESHNADIVDGLLSLGIGTGNVTLGNLANAIESTDNLWLELSVNGETLTPRQQMLSVPFALRSHNTSLLEGNDTAAVVREARTGMATSAELASHISDSSIHQHAPTQFSELTGSLDSAQLPAEATTDTELSDAISNHDHNTLYYSRGEVDALLGTLTSQIASLQATISNLQSELAGRPDMSALNNVVSVSGSDVVFTGVNLHLRNGSGSTESANGNGNLVIGYNESRSNPVDNIRSGSHNLILGQLNNYSATGSVISGTANSVTGNHSVMLATESSNITTTGAAVIGGNSHTVDAYGGAVFGGQGGTITTIANNSVILGGSGNRAEDQVTALMGGAGNTANFIFSSAVGGNNNTSSGLHSITLGGQSNLSSGNYAVSSGGRNNESSDNYSSTLGGEDNRALADFSVITAGNNNEASGKWSSVSGGSDNAAIGESTVVVGGSTNKASGLGNNSVVVGGQNNESVANNSVVLGGENNATSGVSSVISGGEGNRTVRGQSVISKGKYQRQEL